MAEDPLSRHRRLLKERRVTEAKKLLRDAGLLDVWPADPAPQSLTHQVQALHDRHQDNWHTAIANIMGCTCFPQRHDEDGFET